MSAELDVSVTRRIALVAAARLDVEAFVEHRNRWLAILVVVFLLPAGGCGDAKGTVLPRTVHAVAAALNVGPSEILVDPRADSLARIEEARRICEREPRAGQGRGLLRSADGVDAP